MCVILSWMGEWFEKGAHQPRAEAHLWRLWLIPALFLPFSLLPFVFHPGSWSIDSEAITYIPQFGRPRKLKWSEVERVLWTVNEMCLKGSERKISFRRPGVISGVDRKAWDRIAAILSVDFDLKPVKLWYTKEEVKRYLADSSRPLAILLMIFIVWSMFGIGLMCWIWKDAQLRFPQRTDIYNPIPILIVMQLVWMLLFLLPVGLILQRPLIREAKRLHPKYPWRLRKPSLEVHPIPSADSSRHG